MSNTILHRYAAVPDPLRPNAMDVVSSVRTLVLGLFQLVGFSYLYYVVWTLIAIMLLPIQTEKTDRYK